MPTTVADLMQKRVLTAGTAESSEDAWTRMRAGGIRHLVVLEEGQVVGVLSDRDLAGERGIEMRKGRSVKSMMTRGAVSIPPGASIHTAAGLMRTHNIGCLPVMQKGRLRGIVTTTDLLDFVLEHPGEIVEGAPSGNARGR